ncbi:GNAT family N-acetyltransferase [Nonomuraea phyllanthi]|uniref:GNAT family N-acetyltransferase n=1 Tax=Nonomuraea phyllanthi TaxID=2219224 RepID=UPI001D13F885|nr:GNAT family protein [Nonomuraea phyllanthi]
MSVALLRVELGVIWRLDGRGRLPGPEDLVVGVAADGMAAAVSGRVPDPLAARLLDLVSRSTPSPPGRPPDVLARCRALLGGGLTVSGGPAYLVRPPFPPDGPEGRLVRPAFPPGILTSDDPRSADLVRPLRPDTWEPEEWAELVGGGAGSPWAMIVEDGQVASICHSARLTPGGAEAGTWTAPAFRGRGYAAAATVAWAALLPGIPLFYSTDAANRSSRRVAERLGLRALGWLWKLTS